MRAELKARRVLGAWCGTWREELNADGGDQGRTGYQDIQIDLSEFEERIATIDEPQYRLLAKTRIILDEGFPSSMPGAVGFLNWECGMSIRLLRLDMYVANDWTLGAEGLERQVPHLLLGPVSTGCPLEIISCHLRPNLWVQVDQVFPQGHGLGLCCIHNYKYSTSCFRSCRAPRRPISAGPDTLVTDQSREANCQ